MPDQHFEGVLLGPVESGPSTGRALHDTHCHVDLFPDPAEVVREAETERVYTVAVTTLPSCFGPMERLAADSKFVRPALGLHPELVAERAGELPQFLAALPRTRYVGEVGLDYTTGDESVRSAQRRVLTEVVSACDAAGDKILTVHSRRAAEDLVDIFGANFRGSYILHWYSGSTRALRRGLANGAYASVNLAMLRSERGRVIVAEVPMDRVLIESDGPFVKRAAGRRNTMVPAGPATARDVAQLLSKVWGVDLPTSIELLHANFRRLLAT
jgi:TatD DNase family protein